MLDIGRETEAPFDHSANPDNDVTETVREYPYFDDIVGTK